MTDDWAVEKLVEYMETTQSGFNRTQVYGLARLLREARARGIEEAAVICETVAQEESDHGNTHGCAAADFCSERIRKLKEQP